MIREGTFKELCMNEGCIPLRRAAKRWDARGKRLKDRWREVEKETEEKEEGGRAVAGIIRIHFASAPSAKH